MNKMIDPRTCEHFRMEDDCPNWDHEVMAHLANDMVMDMSKPMMKPEMFDQACEFCATCDKFSPMEEMAGSDQMMH